MEIQDIIRVNQLWKNIYPYLVKQISETRNQQSGKVLELGPFSGGISFHLAQQYPLMEITIADEREEMLEWFGAETKARNLVNRINIVPSSLEKLDFASESFDLVIMRGAFFFLKDNAFLLGEIYRVLKPGGIALVGGGYGKNAPQSLIDEIADESRVLNDRLGRKWLSIEALKKIAEKNKLSDKTKIWEEGGVWLVVTR